MAELSFTDTTPFQTALSRAGGTHQVQDILNKYHGFKGITLSTISLWTQEADRKSLPPRARQALAIIECALSQAVEIAIAVPPGFWFLAPLLLESSSAPGEFLPDHSSHDVLLPLAANAAAQHLIVSVDRKNNGSEVVDALREGSVTIGFVSQRYKDIVQSNYVNELLVVAEISRGIPLGVARKSVIEEYYALHGGAVPRNSFVPHADILCQRRVAVLSDIAGPLASSSFTESATLRQFKPVLINSYDVEHMAGLLHSGEADIALSWEPDSTQILKIANHLASHNRTNGCKEANDFEILNEITFSEFAIRNYMVCRNCEIGFDLLIRLLECLSNLSKWVDDILKSDEYDISDVPVWEQSSHRGHTVRQLVDRLMSYSATGDSMLQRESLYRALRSTRFELRALDINSLSALYHKSKCMTM